MEATNLRSPDNVAEDEIHLVLGTNLQKDVKLLLWTFKNFPGKGILIFHVHVNHPIRIILGVSFKDSVHSPRIVAAVRQEEQENMILLLRQYARFCRERKVQVRVDWAIVPNQDDIIKGMYEMVQKHKTTKLVMSSRSMYEKMALLPCCEIWLVRGGRHVATRGPTFGPTMASNEEDGNQEPTTPLMWLDSEDRTLYNTASNDSKKCNSSEIHTATCSTIKLEREELRREVEEAKAKARLSQEQKEYIEQKQSMLQQKIDEQMREIQDLRMPRHFTEFTMTDIRNATSDFDISLKIGEGGYGIVYKGVIRETQVAVKRLKPDSKQGLSEYQREVLVLSRIRHPNIVALIGVCPESLCLIYEYHENGNVEDRLSRKKETLSWKDRTRIISEQRSALVFLHYNMPCIIHADIKLSNILLDANNASRLGDFGIARMVYQERTEDTASICRNTTPTGTVGYMDPSLLSGELTPKSDIYSFGIMLLRLVTALPVKHIVEQVDEALRTGILPSILDATAGQWPVAETEQLVRLALRCCHIEPRCRPGFLSDDWRILDIFKAMAGN